MDCGSGLSAPRPECQQLGYEKSDEPDRRRVASVGSEENGEKSRSDDEARNACPPERYSRGEDEPDPAELAKARQHGVVLPPTSLLSWKRKSIAPTTASCSSPARLFA